MDQCIETLGGAPGLENRFVTQVLVAQVELDCPPKTRLCLPVVFHFPGKSGNRTSCSQYLTWTVSALIRHVDYLRTPRDAGATLGDTAQLGRRSPFTCNLLRDLVDNLHPIFSQTSDSRTFEGYS